MAEQNASSPTGWSDEQMINVGQMAGEALGNPVFQVIHNLLKTKYYQEWRALPEHHTKEAAGLKARELALDDVIGTMVAMRDRAQDILTKRHEANSPQRQEQERLDTQGFGLNYND